MRLLQRRQARVQAYGASDLFVTPAKPAPDTDPGAGVQAVEFNRLRKPFLVCVLRAS